MKKLLHTRTILVLGLLVFGFSFGVSALNIPKASADAADTFCEKKFSTNSEQDECAEAYQYGQDHPDDVSTYCGPDNGTKTYLACRTGVSAGASAGPGEANEAPSEKKKKAKEKAEKAKKAQKKAEEDAKKAKKAVDKAEAARKKACAGDKKDSKACKAAEKALETAKNKHKSAKERAETARRTSASLSSAYNTGGCGSKTFFGLVPWYAYLGDEFSSTNPGVNQGDNCTLKCFNFLPQETENECGVKHSDIPYVLLAIIDDLLRISGLVAVIFVIVGAIKYITSQGDPEGTASAQNTLVNALVGMAIAIVAVAFVTFLGNRIGR